MSKFSKQIISKRFIILALIGGITFIGIRYYNISLWYILIAGIISGVVFGKVFCRWACPMGFIMELVMSLNPDNKLSQMYQYHKFGCPIAWISGYLNKISIFKIRLNLQTCKTCGLCDKQCYISTLEPTKYSLYKEDKLNPANTYTCSKCLKCVEVCPNESLKYKI